MRVSAYALASLLFATAASLVVEAQDNFFNPSPTYPTEENRFEQKKLTVLPVRSITPGDPPLQPPQKRRYLILPPVEFDKPYTGNLTIERVATVKEVIEKCRLRNTVWALGCAFEYSPDRCHIVLVEDNVIKSFGWTYEAMMRHEIGHCHSWPGHHPGERPWDGGKGGKTWDDGKGGK